MLHTSYKTRLSIILFLEYHCLRDCIAAIIAVTLGWLPYSSHLYSHLIPPVDEAKKLLVGTYVPGYMVILEIILFDITCSFSQTVSLKKSDNIISQGWTYQHGTWLMQHVAVLTYSLCCSHTGLTLHVLTCHISFNLLVGMILGVDCSLRA